MNSQGRKRGPVSKQALYSAASAHAHTAIEVLVELMTTGKHEATRVGAAKTLLAKCLPDIKATQLTDADGNNIPITIQINTDKPIPVAK